MFKIFSKSKNKQSYKQYLAKSANRSQAMNYSDWLATKGQEAKE